MVSIEHEIRRFIVDNFLFGEEDFKLCNDDSFLQRGIIDSTGVLELVAFLEEKYRIKIEDEELVPANLDCVNDLVRFIDRKIQPTRSEETLHARHS
jgi:acyl carrier protein